MAAELASTNPQGNGADSGVPPDVTLTKIAPAKAKEMENRLYTADELQGVTFTKIDAPQNTVFDQDNDRIVGLPQTLSQTETNFVMKRDVDEVKNFFAMEDVGGFQAFGRGVSAFVLTQPQYAGGLGKEFGELSKNYKPGSMAAEVVNMNPFSRISSIFKTINKPIADEIIAGSDRLIERNKKYMADAGFERPEGDEVAGFLYDLGNGGGSTLASIGLAALTRSPQAAGLYFGAMQKSSVYQEARAAGKSPEAASDISTAAGIIEGGLEYVGLDHFMKALKGNSAVRRFVSGFAIEAVQEASQTAAEEAITQGTGVRDKSLQDTASDILYSAALGGIIGGPTSAAIGVFVKDQAVSRGIDEQTADRMATYAEKNVGTASKNITEFIDKELAPIARDEKSAMEFMTLMQKFGNDVNLVDENSLDPETRAIFNQYVKQFDESVRNPESIQAVEKTFYDKAKSAGVAEDQAIASSKLIGARADAASRALGITPQQWLDSKKISLNGPKSAAPEQRDPMDDRLDQIRGVKKTPQIRDRSQPILSFLKEGGGVKVGSPLAGELRYMGITPKTNVGLFRREGGLSDVDNIDPTTMRAAFNRDVDFKIDGNYIDRQWMLDRMRDETFGNSLNEDTSDDAAIEDLIRELDERGIDIDRFTNKQIKDMLDFSRDEIPFYQSDEYKKNGDLKTSTPEFKAWFGDSKVVDENGDPLVVYHGTPNGNFDQFSNDAKSVSGSYHGRGFYFSSNPGEASAYSLEQDGSAVLPVFLSIKNPYEDNDFPLSDAERKFITDKIGDVDGIENLTFKESQWLNKRLRDAGVDAAALRTDTLMSHGFDGQNVGDGEWVAFSPTQIKSVNNRGTFDPNDPRILYQDNARGSITFKNGEAIIDLFQNANPSTLLHELGHLFLRDMRDVSKVTDRPRVRADYEAVKKWLGAKGNVLTVRQEEKFARGFEQYLREGKAPKPELQGVFDRFKQWLESIYKSAKDLNVELTPEIREVFDRMLGSDYAQAETLNQNTSRAKMERDYAKVAAAPEEKTLWTDTKNVFRDVSNLSSDAFVPISTRLGKIDIALKHAVRRFVFNTGLYTHEDRVKVKPFVEAASDKMEVADYKILDLALKNRDVEKVEALIDQYGLQKEWQAVRDVLDELYIEAQDVGLDLGFIEDYFPRQVKPGMAAEYIAAMEGRDDWSDILFAMREVDPNGTLTVDEQAEFVNKYLRGYDSASIDLSKPSYAKERAVDYVTPEFNRFYSDSMPTLLSYIGGMRHAIESRKLFGKSEKETDDNIGAYVLSLVKEGSIKADQEIALKKILKAVVDPTGTYGAVSWAKNASYIYVMGNPISAITQIQDLAFSLHKNGYWRTTVSLAKSLSGNQVLKKEDLGIDNVLQEFEDSTRASRAVTYVFDKVGLSFMDNIGKEVYIDAAYSRIRRMNKKGGKEYDALMDKIFGAEAAQTKKDLTDGVMSENVKYLLFSELSDIQPISLAEMPVGYLRGGNGRIFYMLKTYTIKQIDIYRREIFDNLASGDLKKTAEGIKNLVGLAAALMLMGMGSDALKDFILGRDIEIDDLVMDNIIKIMGVTKYQIYKSKTEGIMATFWKTLFVPPVGAPIDDLAKDIRQISSGKKELKDAELLGHIPLAGKLYYWWWGGGRAKEEGTAKPKVSTP
jgi:hypothetical protein